MLDTLLDFEAVADPAAAAAGGDAATNAGAATGDTAAALSGQPMEGSAPEPDAPAAPAWSPDDPNFQQFLEERDAQLLARFHELGGPAAAPQPPAGPGIDLNEFLNPLGDNFGENLARFLTDRDQHLLTKTHELFAPVLSDREQAEIQRGSERMDTLIESHWDKARDGDLTVAAKTAIKDLAPAYMDEYSQVYGNTPQAAEKALAKAASTVRAINAASARAGAVANIDGLAAVAAAPGEPGTAGGAVDVPAVAKSPQDVFARYFGPNAARPA